MGAWCACQLTVNQSLGHALALEVLIMAELLDTFLFDSSVFFDNTNNIDVSYFKL